MQILNLQKFRRYLFWFGFNLTYAHYRSHNHRIRLSLILQQIDPPIYQSYIEFREEFIGAIGFALSHIFEISYLLISMWVHPPSELNFRISLSLPEAGCDIPPLREYTSSYISHIGLFGWGLQLVPSASESLRATPSLRYTKFPLQPLRIISMRNG